MPSLAALELSQHNDMNKTLSQMPIICYLSRPMCYILQLFLQTFLLQIYIQDFLFQPRKISNILKPHPNVILF